MVLRVERRVHVAPTLPAASDLLARRLVAYARSIVAERDRFRLVISGGSTPLGLFRRLAGPYRRRMPWTRTELFFADERCVAPTRPESNFGSARQAFLARVPIPRARVHRIRGELRPLPEAARRYEAVIRRSRGVRAGDGPLFDAVLLGIGPDGHTASLFPGQPSLRARRAAVVAVPRAGQPPHVPRISLTLPALSSAGAVWFLVAGDDKRAALARVFGPPGRSRSALPAALVRPSTPTEWFVDAAAARGIPVRARSAG